MCLLNDSWSDFQIMICELCKNKIRHRPYDCKKDCEECNQYLKKRESWEMSQIIESFERGQLG